MTDDLRAQIEALQRQLAELQAQAAQPAGGVSVESGRDTTVEGDVVSGDKLTYIFHLYQSSPGRATLSAAEFERILNDYLRWVRNAHSKARLYGLESLPTARRSRPHELAEVFVPLTLRRFQPLQREEVEKLARGAGDEMAHARAYLRLAEARREQGDTVTLQNLLTVSDRLAIVGGAGSGKSTVLAYLAAQLASGGALPFELPPGRPTLVPLLIPLRYYREYLRLCRESPQERLRHPRTGTLAGFIPWYLRRRNPALETSEDFFDRLLLGGGCLLMLDGLDEVVSRNDRSRVRQEVETLLNDVYPGNRLIVAAREAGYRDDAVFDEDFTRLDVQRLDADQTRALVGNWCRLLYPGEAEPRMAQIVEAIESINALRADRNLPPFISTPLMVTMVVSVQWGETELPRERARLYEACVKVMLQAQYVPDDARQELAEWGGPWEDQRNWLSKLALAMHAGGQAGAAVPEAGVRAALKDELTPEALNQFIQAVRDRGGLLEERAELFQFVHLTFQEFLAARWLAKQRQAGLAHLQPRLADPWWREVILLTYNYAQTDYPPFAREYLNWLSQQKDKSAGPELAGAALLELERPDPTTRQRQARRLLEALSDTNLTAAVRARAGDTLAQLGDPRPEVLTVEAMQFAFIPAGPFIMGDGNEQHKCNALTYDYWLARYPVTNAQFEQFVQAEGYSIADCWPEARAAGFWKNGAFIGPWDNEPRRRPALFSNPFHLPNHPVVGVSWYEALAFTRWLSRLAQREKWLPEAWSVRLPSEAEWEKAARGGESVPPQDLAGFGAGKAGDSLSGLRPVDTTHWIANVNLKRAYPWGNDPDPNRANYSDTQIGTTSAVGAFPGGASPYGLEEMSGNVWEWTRSHYENYPYQNAKEREDLKAGSSVARVLRGGAFNFGVRLARCAFRLGLNPCDWYRNLGFRVAVSRS